MYDKTPATQSSQFLSKLKRQKAALHDLKSMTYSITNALLELCFIEEEN